MQKTFGFFFSFGTNLEHKNTGTCLIEALKVKSYALTVFSKVITAVIFLPFTTVIAFYSLFFPFTIGD